jgi:hypothetical protein
MAVVGTYIDSEDPVQRQRTGFTVCVPADYGLNFILSDPQRGAHRAIT